MRLVVTTPTHVILDEDGVRHVRAEDATGAFGILPRHAPLLTVLSVSVVTFRDAEGRERHLAVRGGVLAVEAGGTVAIATSEAQPGEDLAVLEEAVLRRYREEARVEETARAAAARLESAVLHKIIRYLHPQSLRPEVPAALSSSGDQGV